LVVVKRVIREEDEDKDGGEDEDEDTFDETLPSISSHELCFIFKLNLFHEI
jgi:hypothetical protein